MLSRDTMGCLASCAVKKFPVMLDKTITINGRIRVNASVRAAASGRTGSQNHMSVSLISGFLNNGNA